MENNLFFNIDGIDYFIDKVYLEYEQPELFTVYNIVGNRFLVMLTDEQTEGYLMISISNTKLLQLEYGNISIRDAFLQPEMKDVTRIKKENGAFVKLNVQPLQIPESELPSEDAKLNWNHLTMPQIKEDLYQFAKERQTDIIDIRVDSEQTRNHTIDSKEFGSLLIILNEAVNIVAKEQRRRQGKKRGLTAGCSLKYIGNYAGSFGIRLEGEETSNLLGETALTSVLAELFEILKANGTGDLAEFVKSSSLDNTKALRKLLKYSNDNDASLDFSFATPNPQFYREVIWDKDISKSSLKYLDTLIRDEERDEEFIGDLISVSKKNNNFGFLIEGQEEITGKIDPSLKERVFKVKCHAKIHVKRSIKITNANETEEKFRLIGLEEIE